MRLRGFLFVGVRFQLPEQNFDNLVVSVSTEWNKAEKAIKHAENVDGGVVNPAIFELRYAGRRLVEALAKRLDDEATAIALLRDAKFDCHRARHDAIDAATSKMAGDLNVAVEYLSAQIVMSNFPDFTTFYGDLLQVRQKIAESRENREQRDMIYETIESVDLDRLTQLYGRFRACEPLMNKAAEKEKAELEAIEERAKEAEDRADRESKKANFSLIIGAVGLVIGILGFWLE